jgi:hypothetical protein
MKVYDPTAQFHIQPVGGDGKFDDIRVSSLVRQSFAAAVKLRHGLGRDRLCGPGLERRAVRGHWRGRTLSDCRPANLSNALHTKPCRSSKIPGEFWNAALQISQFLTNKFAIRRFPTWAQFLGNGEAFQCNKEPPTIRSSELQSSL